MNKAGLWKRECIHGPCCEAVIPMQIPMQIIPMQTTATEHEAITTEKVQHRMSDPPPSQPERTTHTTCATHVALHMRFRPRRYLSIAMPDQATNPQAPDLRNQHPRPRPADARCAHIGALPGCCFVVSPILLPICYEPNAHMPRPTHRFSQISQTRRASWQSEADTTQDTTCLPRQVA